MFNPGSGSPYNSMEKLWEGSGSASYSSGEFNPPSLEAALQVFGGSNTVFNQGGEEEEEDEEYRVSAPIVAVGSLRLFFFFSPF